MYQQTVEPFTYPVSRREAEAQLFKATGRSKRPEAPTPEELSQVDLTEPVTFPEPTAPAGQVAVKDFAPTLVEGTWGFNWHLVDLPTPEELLATEREQASVTRRELCLGLAQMGILTGPDAIEAAKGEWPSAMSGFLTYLDEAQALDAQIEWAATGTIDRLHPFILSLASWLSLEETTVDELFGITA